MCGFKKHDRVMYIAYGPYAGLEGIVTRVENDELFVKFDALPDIEFVIFSSNLTLIENENLPEVEKDVTFHDGWGKDEVRLVLQLGAVYMEAKHGAYFTRLSFTDPEAILDMAHVLLRMGMQLKRDQEKQDENN